MRNYCFLQAVAVHQFLKMKREGQRNRVIKAQSALSRECTMERENRISMQHEHFLPTKKINKQVSPFFLGGHFSDLDFFAKSKKGGNAHFRMKRGNDGLKSRQLQSFSYG